MQIEAEFPASLPSHSSTTLQRHFTENSKQMFPERKLRGLVPNSFIHVSVSDLYTYIIYPRSVCLFCCRKIGKPSIQIAHRYMNLEIRTEAARFLFGEYKNRVFFAVHCAVRPV